MTTDDHPATDSGGLVTRWPPLCPRGTAGSAWADCGSPLSSRLPEVCFES